MKSPFPHHLIHDVCELLATNVRCLHVGPGGQLERFLFPDSNAGRRRARRFVGFLLGALLVRAYRIRIPVVGEYPSEPLHRFPEDGIPDLGRIAYQLRKKKTRRNHTVTILAATGKLTARFSGRAGGTRILPSQVWHDLFLAEIALRMRRVDPSRFERFVGEELVAESRSGEKLPDAFIATPGGKPECVIEVAGRGYQKERLESFYESMIKRRLAWELWG